MDTLDLARWQFAITTVYHFLFVPMTIGLSGVVAGLETAYVRTRRPHLLRLTKWFGTLLTINVALGLVTGIVQEFQFGMNWSNYSAFVGDILGAPLALEALLAFFVESTFLGLWLFGWGRIPDKLHAACMWAVHLGTLASAYFILSANSFMQNPVGFRINPDTGRAELTDFVAILTNKVQLITFPHVIMGSYMVGGAIVMVVGIYLMRRTGAGLGLDTPSPGGLVYSTSEGGPTPNSEEGPTPVEPNPTLVEPNPSPVELVETTAMYRTAARIGAVVVLLGGLGVAITGDLQGKVMTEVQPMKMAAAEALYETPPPGECADFSALSIGSLDGEKATDIVTVKCLLSFLGTGSFDGEIEGINDLNSAYTQRYGGDPQTAAPSYVPNVPIAYWNFRFMIGAGLFAAGSASLALWSLRKDRKGTHGFHLPTQRWWRPLIVLTPLATVLGHSFGWIFTEVGRQPWVVFGVLTTEQGVSPGVTAPEIWISMGAFTALYGALAFVELKLLLRYIRRGAPPTEEPTPADSDDRLTFSY
ncbi:cytochrome ubiquinol oxidase subunit I [Demetria terragena]|uniref:cytochrome ubiquinol oxidase subunit I n=1 Tax=Demetria terragena TaxID=63959 RepID=UPI000374F585|nr:cytochrome ubiquinol oxidase subunit I [Demetria terragena]